MDESTVAQIRQTVDNVYRTESRRVFATLIRLLGVSESRIVAPSPRSGDRTTPILCRDTALGWQTTTPLGLKSPQVQLLKV